MNRLKIKSQSGMSNLSLLALIATGAALASVVALSIVQGTGVTTKDISQKKRGLLAAEGTIRMIQKLSQKYLEDSELPSSQGLTNYVKNETNEILVGGFGIESLDADIKDTQESVVPTGPFAGMNAILSTIKFKLKMSNMTGSVSTKVEQTSKIGSIKLFQFAVFSFDYTEWNPNLAQQVKGRVHVNGDACLGASDNFLTLDKITSSGAIYLMNNSKCRITDPNARLRVSDNRSYVEMVSDHGCTSCGGTSLSWKDYALSKWKGNVLDSSHDIPELRLPGVTATATAQQGIDTEGNILTNNGTLRVLIDPIINSNPRTRNAAKFAYLADIRIINGVWYLKDPLNNSSWPGTPIWSDHPGNFQTTNEEGIEDSMNVGQSQLRTLHSWPATPKYFSYYEYDEAQSRLSGDGFGTVSYGNLFRETISGKPHWVPGHWVSNNLKMFCPNNESCTNCSSSIAKATTAMTCAGGSTLHNSVGLLNATRGGFLNGHAHGAKNGSSTSARQLPVNFDIEQFQQALQQTAPGELGSYFGPGKYMNRNFNGIVYIANTWKDSLRGLDGTSTSAPWPPQGSQNDPLQAGDGVANPAPVQRALPFQLCSSSLAGTNYDGPNGGFVIPNCASYNYSGPGGATIDARPNSIRVINGQNLDATLLPKGLTVATNLPLYVQGDFNTSSDVSNRNATPWVSTLMASDFLGHLSNSWDDNFSSWGKNYAQRDASNTTYNHSILTGVTQRAKSGGGTRETAGLNTITRYNEDWSSATQTINGSIVIGFNSVYFTFANVCCSINTYQPPTRKWNYDEHLLSYGKQPPGSPAFFIYAVESWRSGD